MEYLRDNSFQFDFCCETFVARISKPRTLRPILCGWEPLLLGSETFHVITEFAFLLVVFL